MKGRVVGALHALAFGVTALLYVLVVAPLSRLRAARRRGEGGRPATLWGPIPLIAIRNWALAARTAGYRSDTLVYAVYPINAREDFDIVLDRWTRIPLFGRLVPYAAFLRAGLRYDIFNFFFDGGLLWQSPFWRLELPLLRLAGKKILVTCYGSDARLASRTRAGDRWNAYTDVRAGDEDRSEDDVRRHHAAFDRWADVMLGYNDLVEDLPRLDGILRFPLDQEVWGPAAAPDDEIVTIVHASNHRHYKGTRFLIDAVERLQAEGLPVELDLVEGVPNEEARARYGRADVIATDFLVGGYAYFAVEGMALGKPVLSYLPTRLERFYPEWRECPVVNANPETLVDELRRLVVDPELRASLGRQGPEYVRKYHSLDAVGAYLDGIYRRLWDAPVGAASSSPDGSGS